LNITLQTFLFLFVPDVLGIIFCTLPLLSTDRSPLYAWIFVGIYSEGRPNELDRGLLSSTSIVSSLTHLIDVQDDNWLLFKGRLSHTNFTKYLGQNSFRCSATSDPWTELLLHADQDSSVAQGLRNAWNTIQQIISESTEGLEIQVSSFLQQPISKAGFTPSGHLSSTWSTKCCIASFRKWWILHRAERANRNG